MQKKTWKKKKKRQCHQPIIILSCGMCYRVQVDICLSRKNSGTHGEVALYSLFLIIPKLLLACPLVMLQH